MFNNIKLFKIIKLLIWKNKQILINNNCMIKKINFKKFKKLLNLLINYYKKKIWNNLYLQI